MDNTRLASRWRGPRTPGTPHYRAPTRVRQHGDSHGVGLAARLVAEERSADGQHGENAEPEFPVLRQHKWTHRRR